MGRLLDGRLETHRWELTPEEQDFVRDLEMLYEDEERVGGNEERTMKFAWVEEIKRRLGEQEDPNDESRQAIEALRDTDFKDPDAFFRMVQLFKGLAAGAKDSDLAAEFLSQLSDDVTRTANTVLGE